MEGFTIADARRTSYTSEEVADYLGSIAWDIDRRLARIGSIEGLPHSLRARDYRIEVDARRMAAKELSEVSRMVASEAAMHRMSAEAERGAL
jgi:hypothetical protein